MALALAACCLLVAATPAAARSLRAAAAPAPALMDEDMLENALAPIVADIEKFAESPTSDIVDLVGQLAGAPLPGECGNHTARALAALARPPATCRLSCRADGWPARHRQVCLVDGMLPAELRPAGSYVPDPLPFAPPPPNPHPHPCSRGCWSD